MTAADRAGRRAPRSRADPRGGLRPDRRGRDRRRPDRAGRQPGRRLDRARPPLLLDPRGPARAGAAALLRPGRRRAFRRPTAPSRRRARPRPRSCPGDRRVPAAARPPGARVGAVGRALAARGARPSAAPGGGPPLRALPSLDRGGDPRRRRRAASSHPSTPRALADQVIGAARRARTAGAARRSRDRRRSRPARGDGDARPGAGDRSEGADAGLVAVIRWPEDAWEREDEVHDYEARAAPGGRRCGPRGLRPRRLHRLAPGRHVGRRAR